MAGDLLLPRQFGHGNPSASQRREIFLQAKVDHYLHVIAVLVSQAGGAACVPKASLARDYDLGWKIDPESGAIFYTSEPKKPEPAAPPAAEPPKEPTT